MSVTVDGYRDANDETPRQRRGVSSLAADYAVGVVFSNVIEGGKPSIPSKVK